MIRLCFGNLSQRKAIQAKAQTNEPIVSTYVIYEIARGYVRNLLLLHNKTLHVAGFSELLRYAATTRLKSHLQGSVLGALEMYFEANESANPINNQERLAYFRGFVRRLIRRGWNELTSSNYRRINSVGCRELSSAPKVNQIGMYEQELNKQLCGAHQKCGLKRYVASCRRDFEHLRAELQHIEKPDLETQTRIRALRGLYRVDNRDFTRGDCYACGDAIIAHECPSDAILITNNKRHLELICAVFGRKVEYF